MRKIKQLCLMSVLMALMTSSVLAQGGPEEIPLTIGKSI